MSSFALLAGIFCWCADGQGLVEVGAAAVEIPADDSMVIAGGISPGRATGQEGKLRAVAVVVRPTRSKASKDAVAIVACDVLFVTRDLIDPVLADIEKTLGIPAANILVNATHTHHAPSTARVHDYGRDEVFCKNMQKAIVDAVRTAYEGASGPCQFDFWLGEESSFGQNSRLLLSDQTIFWIGPHDDALRPTGPFDPELPVLAFRDADKKLRAAIFNHSTHTIGTRQPGVRSPSIYGLACQELEDELGGTFCFLEGASGSTHNLYLKADEGILRMKAAVKDALDQAQPHPVTRLAAIKRRFPFRIRKFNEAKEDAAVHSYCAKRAPSYAEDITRVFRDQRAVLAPLQGEERTTWLQVVQIGDVAIVGVPAEYFTRLGQQIKRRSPFRYTYVAELANDWIGYLPNREAFDLGGYQTWTGLHSYAEPGTGEAIVDEVVDMLNELHDASAGGGKE